MYTYFLSLTSDIWTPAEDILLSYVSPERHARILRYVHMVDRKLSLYAALLIRMALLIHTSLTAKDLHFRCQGNHKPVLLTDSSIDFSFSHTRNAVLCCISPDTTVGADVELCSKAPYEIMDIVFHKEETAYVSAATETEKQERFFRIWTQKEAYTKRNGTGLVCDLTNINTLEPSIAASLHSWQTDNYICSVCGNFAAPPIPQHVSTNDVFEFFTGRPFSHLSRCAKSISHHKSVPPLPRY